MSEEKLTLDDLKSEGSHETVIDATVYTEPIEEPKEVDIGQIRSYTGPEKIHTLIDEQFSALHNAVDRERDKILEKKAEAYSIIEEGDMAAEDAKAGISEEDPLGSLNDGDKSTPVVQSQPKAYVTPNTQKPAETVDTAAKITDVVTATKSISSINSDDKDFLADFADEDGNYEDEAEVARKEEERMNKIKKVVSEKIKPYDNAIDLSRFSFGAGSINSTRALGMSNTEISTADWVLFNSKRPFTMSALSGSEIQKMDTSSNNKNPINAYKEIYRIIYDHIVDENKPEDFTTWLKTTRFADDADIFFTAYMATFNKNHSIPYTCVVEDCQEVFMTDLSFKDLVKYDNDEIRAEVERIRNKDLSSVASGEYEVVYHQISDNYVVALKNPSLYDVLFEPRTLDAELVEKYLDLIGLMSYIDDIYFINRDENSLVKINTYPDPKNASKTAMHKYREFYKILSTLNSDQQAALEGKINKIDTDAAKIKYILPEVTCPKCGTVIPESDVTPLTLLFMRHRVAKLADF